MPRGHEKRKDQKHMAKKQTKTIKQYPFPVLPPTLWCKSTTCDPSYYHIICNNNTMDMELLVKMRQSNKCGSVRVYQILNLHFEFAAAPKSAYCVSC